MDPSMSKRLPSNPAVVFDLTVSDPKARVQAFLDDYRKLDRNVQESTELSTMIQRLKVISASKSAIGTTATVTLSTTVIPQWCNIGGFMHGGAVSTAIDVCTTLAQAPLARPGFWEFGGVSRTLSVTYLRPIPLNTEVLIECEVMQVGKVLATIQAKIYRKADMLLLCTGEHNKVLIGSLMEGPKL